MEFPARGSCPSSRPLGLVIGNQNNGGFTFMFIRPLILSIAAVLCAGALAAQEFDAVPADAFGPQTISRRSGDTVTVDFGLKPLVHGPYTLTVRKVDAPDATVMLNGTEIFRPEEFGILEVSRSVTLDSANTLEVTFYGDRPDSALIVSIDGWKYMFADAYPTTTIGGDVEPDAYPSGSVDWRTKGAVTPIKNQGQCDASWAFSAAGVVEGNYAITHGELPNLSAQQLIDCSGARTCEYDDTDAALKYALISGLTTTASYPYTARVGSCKVRTGPYKISGIVRLPVGNENALGAAVDIEPVSVVLNGYWFSTYVRGVANPPCESHYPEFVSALIVGYGYDSASGLNYWLVKNSLGTSWGESGYFRIVRGQNKCGIADYALYAR
jgi:hypothetical protein